jgi:membrane-bound lytic murein transglycosylase B
VNKARRLAARALVPLLFVAAPPTTTTTPKGGSDQVALGPQTPATVDAAAVRVGSLRDELTALNAHQVDLQNQLAAAEQVTADRRASLDDATRIATDTLLKARRQALIAYMFGDPSTSQEAVIRSLFAESPGDAVWGVTMVHIVAAERDAIARAAAQARTQADTELLGAISAQQQVATDLAAVGPQITDTESKLQQAQTDLITVVIRLGQSTIEGLTTVAYEAYTRAARALGEEQPKCGLRWELLAAIGRTESNHGAGRIDANGDTAPPILGPPIGPDTDGGEWDSDPTQDHAVGPMQFIPSTWKKWGADGNADTRMDPSNIFDETLAAGRYLCRAAGDLTLLSREGVAAAIWSYNPNLEYLRLVGARFEALANDLAAGWFSGANLPVPPGAVVVEPGGVTGGGTTPPTDPPPPPRLVTDVHALALFGPDGLPVVAGEVPAACEAQTWALAPRANLARCATQPVDGSASQVLDPCAAAPADPTLLACVGDPTQPERVVRVPAALLTGEPSNAPPYYGVELSGGDMCLPWRDETPPPPPGPPPSSTTTTVPGPPPQTTTTSTTTTAATSTTTVASTTTAPIITLPTTAPGPPPPPTAYQCRSGALVLGQPDTSGPTWTARVSQRGLSPRVVDLAAAFT